MLSIVMAVEDEDLVRVIRLNLIADIPIQVAELQFGLQCSQTKRPKLGWVRIDRFRNSENHIGVWTKSFIDAWVKIFTIAK